MNSQYNVSLEIDINLSIKHGEQLLKLSNFVMAGNGSIQPFDFSSRSWKQEWRRFWPEFELYMLITNNPKLDNDAGKCAALLLTMGSKAIQIKNAFDIPEDKVNDFSYLVNKFNDYFQPRERMASIRFRFNCANQEPGESLDDYFIRVQNLADECDYGSRRDSIIRDKIISGILNSETRQRLLSITL